MSTNASDAKFDHHPCQADRQEPHLDVKEPRTEGPQQVPLLLLEDLGRPVLRDEHTTAVDSTRPQKSRPSHHRHVAT